MTRYHVNPETQRPNICRAEKQGCKYAVSGQEPRHFSTKDEARAWIEEEAARKDGGNALQGIVREPSTRRRRGEKATTPDGRFSGLPPFTEEHLERLMEEQTHPLRPLRDRDGEMPNGVSTILGKKISLVKMRIALKQANTEGDMLYKPGSLRVMHWAGSFTVLYEDAINGDSMVYRVSDDGEAFLRNEPDENYRELVDHVIAERFPDKGVGGSMEARAVEHIFSLAERIEGRSQEEWEEDPHAVAISYLGEGHAAMNAAMRDGTASDTLLASLDAFSTEDTLEKDTVVYRGVRAMGEDDVKASLGEDSRGLLSTTTKATTAVNFSGNRAGSVVMRMVLPKGTRCRVVEGDESEIILPRDAEVEHVETLRLTKRLRKRE